MYCGNKSKLNLTTTDINKITCHSCLRKLKKKAPVVYAKITNFPDDYIEDPLRMTNEVAKLRDIWERFKRTRRANT